MTYEYSIHGLTVQSQFEIAGLRSAPSPRGEADVSIELGKAPSELAGPVAFADGSQVSGQEILLNVQDVARYWMRDGRSIVVDRYPGARTNDVLIYLLGSGLAGILHQKGYFPLHASAFVRGDHCVGFMGDSGVGKSTLAALLSLRGFRLLSDDVLVTIPTADRQLLAMPSSVAVKLTPHSASLTGFKNHPECFDGSDQAKLRIEASERFAEQPARLAALYLLKWLNPASAPPEVERIQPFDALKVLRQNVYQPALIDAMGREGPFLTFASTVISRVRLSEFRRGRCLEAIQAQTDTLMQHALRD